MVFRKRQTKNQKEISYPKSLDFFVLKQDASVKIVCLIGIFTIMKFFMKYNKKTRKKLIDDCTKIGWHTWKFIPVKGYQYGPDYYQCKLCLKKKHVQPF